MRKKRSDRNHIIYKITNQVTQEFYIGITQCLGRAYLTSIKKRFKQHVSRAFNDNLEWAICRSIREYGETAFKIEIQEVVRGKRPAHSRETQLIQEFKPSLNTTSILTTNC